MICLYAETHFSTFALLFYTCICVPVVRMLTFLFLVPHHQPQSSEGPDWELDLPETIFEDLKSSEGEETCAICLTGFEKDDRVNKLRRCSHVFHMHCLEKWVDTCHFTCPLCRSSLLRVPSSPCNCKPSANLIAN